MTSSYYNLIDDVTDVEVISYPHEIMNHNTVGLCSEDTCDSAEKRYTKIRLYGTVLFIVLCDKHAEEIEEAITHKPLGTPKMITILENGECSHCGRRHEPFEK